MFSQYIRSVSLCYEPQKPFNCYPFSLPVVRSLSCVEFHPKVTYFIGENGSGKSTLLEAIAIASGFNAEGGSKNFNFATRRSHSELHRYLRIAKGAKRPRTGFFLRAESFFNVATEIEKLDSEPNDHSPPVIASYGGKSLHEQSHGEAFLALLTNRFGSDGLYILDEPETALSPQRQLSVLARIHDLALCNCQFIIVTHSPILMAYPDSIIYQCDDKGLTRIAYEHTEHFQVARNFLANPQRTLRILFERHS
jgi:predicted ATPase